VTLILGDCLEAMAEMEPDSVDAVVTDPPYGLGFMGKKWDVMPPGGEVAAAMLRVLKPAHYLLAFGGTRTHHRLMVALEDAGFEIRDCLMWLYGSGFPKGKGQLKPAYEPIILCRKPGGKVRALGIDECRIEATDGFEKAWDKPVSTNISAGSYVNPERHHIVDLSAYKPSGRWPANIVIDEEAGALIDEQSGPCKTGRLSPHHGNGALPRKDGWGFRQGTQVNREYGGDSGGASRFYYCAKASRSERNAGCEGLEAKQRDLSRNADQPSMNGGEGNPFNRGVVPVSNHHPTVKPVALMRWLVRLICPPGGLVLDPFMGSGTTGVACMQEGREFIGVECEPEYIAIAEARISHSLALQTQLVV